MLVLVFYVPEDYLEKVKSAVFNAGGGRIGDYDQCAWQVKGEGQFRPLEGSDPFLGKQGAIEKVAEYRVEMVLEEKLAEEVVLAMKQAHPFEEPAYHVLRAEPY